MKENRTINQAADCHYHPNYDSLSMNSLRLKLASYNNTADHHEDLY